MRGKKSKKKRKTATVEQVLVFYDEPQVLLLRSSNDLSMIAVAVEEYFDWEQPFYGCEVREKNLKRYMQEKADLHFLFSQAVGDRYYMFDLGHVEEQKMILVTADGGPAAQEKYWPQQGFFARAHTNAKQHSGLAQKTFKIDGKWGASDFSRFHGKMSDLYAFYSAVDRFDGEDGDLERAELANLIGTRFWQGGGSYGGFYDDLERRVGGAFNKPLEVAAIHYSSPGEVIFRGDAGALGEVAAVVSVFSDESATMKETYDKVRSILKKENLLGAAPDAGFSSKAIRIFVRKLSFDLARLLEIDKRDDLYRACGGKPLVFAKVVMSIYRRARELHEFYQEGRVQTA